MNILVQRIRENKVPEDVIIGKMSIDDLFHCFTVERYSLAIPSGIYPVSLYTSPRLHYEVLLLHNVFEREMIEVHIANFAKDVVGCIGVGQLDKWSWVANSKVAFEELMKVVKPMFPFGEPVTITVKDIVDED